MEPIRLSLVVPAYNEERRLGGNLRRILEYLRGRDYLWELIVVEDGSRDRTKELALAALQGCPSARLLSFERNRGKGFAVREGMLASKGRFVIFLDVDLSVPIDTCERAVSLLESGWDAVLGSRLLPESRILNPQPRARRWGSRLFHMARKIMIPSGVGDSQCGFKAFEGELARRLFALSRVDGFMFDVELIRLLELEGALIKEMPVDWSHLDGSRFSVSVHAMKIITELFEIKWGRL